MSPVYISRNVWNGGNSRAVGQDGTHLKLDVIDDSGKHFSGIAFSLAPKYLAEIKQNKKFDICYTVEENEYMGNTTLQLRVKEIKMKD